MISDLLQLLNLCFLLPFTNLALLELSVAEDPKVPTRKQIKFWSKKIVDANVKAEDEA